MAKQRNSLGLCVLDALTDGVMSFDNYKKKFGIDLNDIVFYDEGNASAQFRLSFTKILCVDFRNLAKYMEWTGSNNVAFIIINPQDCNTSGDKHEIITFSNGVHYLKIDTINKTLTGGEN